MMILLYLKENCQMVIQLKSGRDCVSVLEIFARLTNSTLVQVRLL